MNNPLESMVSAVCPLCGYNWMRWPDESVYCYGCWDAARTYTVLQTAESSAEDIAAYLWECADRNNLTEATVRRHWRRLVAEVEADRAAQS